MPYANNSCADQPAHSRSLISFFVVRCLDSIIPIRSISKSKAQASFCSWAGPSLTWSQIPKTGFLVTRLKWSHTWHQTREVWSRVNTNYKKKFYTDQAVREIVPHNTNCKLHVILKITLLLGLRRIPSNLVINRIAFVCFVEHSLVVIC